MTAIFYRDNYGRVAYPLEHCQRHAVVVDALRRLVIDEYLGIENLTRANRKRPIVAGNIVRAGRRVELENYSNVVWYLFIREVCNESNVVPKPEESGICRLRIPGDRAEGFGAKCQDIVVKRSLCSIGHAPVAQPFVILERFQVKRRKTRINYGL